MELVNCERATSETHLPNAFRWVAFVPNVCAKRRAVLRRLLRRVRRRQRGHRREREGERRQDQQFLHRGITPELAFPRTPRVFPRSNRRHAWPALALAVSFTYVLRSGI